MFNSRHKSRRHRSRGSSEQPGDPSLATEDVIGISGTPAAPNSQHRRRRSAASRLPAITGGLVTAALGVVAGTILTTWLRPTTSNGELPLFRRVTVARGI